MLTPTIARNFHEYPFVEQRIRAPPPPKTPPDFSGTVARAAVNPTTVNPTAVREMLDAICQMLPHGSPWPLQCHCNARGVF